HAGAQLHHRKSRRGRKAWTVPGVRVEQDEDADADPRRRAGGDVGLRADGAGAGAAGDDGRAVIARVVAVLLAVVLAKARTHYPNRVLDEDCQQPPVPYRETPRYGS